MGWRDIATWPFNGNAGAAYGQLGSGITGGIIGSLGGPAGFAIGFAIGSVLGGVLFPYSTSGQNAKRSKGVGIQTSCKGMALPIVYGSCRVAGNVVWMSDMRVVAHEEQDTVVYYKYYRSFLIALREGPASVLRIWKDKTEIDPTDYDIVFYSGSGNSGLEADIESCWHKSSKPIDVDGMNLKTVCCVLFKNYKLANGMTDPPIPNFTFEVCNGRVPLFVSEFQYAASTNIAHVYDSEGNLNDNFAGNGTYGDGLGVGGKAIIQTSYGFFVLHDELTIAGTVYRGCYFNTAGGDALVIGQTIANAGDTKTAVIKDIKYITATAGIMVYELLTGTAFSYETVDDDAGNSVGVRTSYNTAIGSFLDSTGSVLTDKGFGGYLYNFYDTPTKAVRDSSGNIYICFTGGVACSLIKINEITGLIQWAKGENVSYPTFPQHFSSLQISKDGDYLLGGHHGSAVIYYTGGQYNSSLWKIKTSDGSLDTEWGAANVTDPTGETRTGLFSNSEIFPTTPTALAIHDVRINGADGKIYISHLSHSSEHYAGYHWGMAKILADGSGLDESWGNHGRGSKQYQIYDAANNSKDNNLVITGGGICYGLARELDSAAAETGNQKLIKIDTRGNVTVLADLGTTTRIQNSLLQIGGRLISGGDNYDGGAGYSHIHLWELDGTYVQKYENYSGGRTYRMYVLSGGGSNPADIIYDLLTNTRYGAGIPTSMVDSDSFADVATYCTANGFLCSFYLNQQQPVQDHLDFICSHFWGFLVASDGKIKLRAFRDQPSLATIVRDNLVLPDAESTDPPIGIKKRMYKDTFNRIELQWTNPNAGYEIAVATANDEVDQRQSNKIRTKTVDFTGYTDGTMAQVLAYRMLWESLYRHSFYNFVLGYKDMLVEAGDVITISDGFAITNRLVRITSISETKDGGNLAIEAVDEVPELYEAVGIGSQTSVTDIPESVDDNPDLTGLVYYKGDQVYYNGVQVLKV